MATDMQSVQGFLFSFLSFIHVGRAAAPQEKQKCNGVLGNLATAGMRFRGTWTAKEDLGTP